MLIVWLIKLKVSLIHLNIWTFRWSYLILTGSNEPWSPKLGGLPQTPLHTMTGQLSACWLPVDICSVYTSSAIAHPALPMSSIYFTWLMRGSKRIIFTILRPQCHHFFFLKKWKWMHQLSKVIFSVCYYDTVIFNWILFRFM